MSEQIYEMVTERITAELEAGRVPWRQNWRASGTPRNLSDRPYRGINVLMLLVAGYSDPRWGTLRQINAAGGRIRRGERSTPVIYWRRLDVEDAAAPGGHRTIPLLRYYRVFNVAQAEGLELPAIAPRPIVEPITAAESIVAAMPNPPAISWNGGSQACYSRATDSIHMPSRDDFETPAGVYETLFHELGHSTGHESRLARHDDARGLHAYGREELVAELTSAFLCAEAGIDVAELVRNQAAYVAGWLDAIRADRRALVVAAGAAQRAADYILDRKPVTETSDVGDVAA